MTGETELERPRPLEIELKYRPRNLAAGERYLTADEIGAFTPSAPTRTTQLQDRYLDTVDGALARAGFAARVRVSARGTVVTVKSTGRRGSEPGPHRREELEGPADRTLAPRDWPASDARSLILELCGDAPLVELVTVRQLRRKRELRHGGTHVELSLDEVDVVVRSEVVERFVELEVELMSGDEARLLALAEVLTADPDLRDARDSKLEVALAAARSHGLRAGTGTTGTSSRGRASARQGRPRERRARTPATGGAPEASDDTRSPANEDAVAGAGPSAGQWPDAGMAHAQVPAPPAPDQPGGEVEGAALPVAAAVAVPDEPARLVVGRTPGVLADDPVAEAGRKVLRFHLARMLAKEAGAREGSRIEDLHGMRVATRRMRAAWRVFGYAFRPDRTRRYRRRLREVAGRLGAVRDLDVLLEGVEAYLAALPEPEQVAVEPLVAAWRRYREDARILLLHELDAPGYARFAEDFRVFVQTDGAGALPVAATAPHRVRDTAPSRIWAAYEQVRAYEPVLRWADVETLHELRIAAKWLRYTIEFVREPLGPEVNPLVERVVVLQDHLGLMHDADVASSMARTFLVEHAASLSGAESAAIGRYLVSREREVARLKRTVGGPWRGVAGLAFRRRLGRVVAGL